jgi:hypothetical protein
MNNRPTDPLATVSARALLSGLACTLLFALLFAVALPASGQKVRPRQSVDLKQLQRKFEAVVGKDFEFIKGELKRRSNASGGGTYWLAHLKPKSPGSFKLTYRYNYNDPHYSHVEREFGLNVGRQGCRRGVPNYGSYHRFCVGDTIIFPVAIFNFTEHEFSLTSTPYTVEQDAAWEKSYPSDESVSSDPVNNPLAEQLKYVGNSSHRLLHRNGGYTLEGYAVFEAQNPGRFNVTVSAVYPDVASAVLSGIRTGGGPSIIVVSRATPVTLLASHHEVRGYTMGYNGQEYVSSTSGDAYMIDVMILQPGDRISLKYFTTIRSARDERSEFVSGNKTDDSPLQAESVDKIPLPLIYKLPFTLNTEYNYTEWLVDYLPR